MRLIDAPAFAKRTQDLIDRGLIVRVDNEEGFEFTPAGEAWRAERNADEQRRREVARAEWDTRNLHLPEDEREALPASCMTSEEWAETRRVIDQRRAERGEGPLDWKGIGQPSPPTEEDMAWACRVAEQYGLLPAPE